MKNYSINDFIKQFSYLRKSKTVNEAKSSDLCNFMIMTPTPLHNGGVWCAEKYPCERHGKWRDNKVSDVIKSSCELTSDIDELKNSIIEKAQSLKIDIDKCEKEIIYSFGSRIKKMKKVAKEKNWSSKKWNDWHNFMMRKKGTNLVIMRASVKTKNRAIKQLISIVGES